MKGGSTHADGHEKLFTALFRQQGARVFYYFKRYVKKDELAEDLLQEVFASIWMKRESLFTPDPHSGLNRSVEAYLFVAARNHLYNYLDKTLQQSQRLVFLENIDPGYSHIEEEMLGKETKEKYLDILNSLSPQRKKAFTLSREHSLSYQEIADHMSIHPRTVEKHISAVLQVLRVKLGRIIPILLFFTIW